VGLGVSAISAREDADAFVGALAVGDEERLSIGRAMARFPSTIRVRGLFFLGLGRVVAEKGGRAAFRAMAARAGVEPEMPAFSFFPHRDFYKMLLLAAVELHPGQPLRCSLHRLAQSFYPMFQQSLIGKAMSSLVGDNGGRLVRLLPEAYAHSVHGNEHHVEMVSEREYRWSCTVEPFDDYPSIFAGIIEGSLRAQKAGRASVETLGSVLGVSSHKFLFKITW
jgi:uncharacterized protein (TIGR02265 family)